MRILIVLAALRQGQFHLEDLRTGSASEFRENYAKKRTAKCENVKIKKKCEKLWKPKNLKLELEFQCSFFMPT